MSWAAGSCSESVAIAGFVTLEADGELQATTPDIENNRIAALNVVRNADKPRHLHSCRSRCE